MWAVAGGRSALHWVLVAGLAVAATGACRGGTEAPSAATVPEVGPTTTVAADEWTVPAAIDAAYVERVLAELDRIDGEAARIIVAEGELVAAAVDRMRAIYGTDELNFQLEVWNELIAKDFEGVKDPPGQRRTEVEQLLSASADCIFAEVRTDFSETATTPPPPSREFVTLKPVETAHDPHLLNRTSWAVDAVRIPQAGEDAVDRCVR